MDFRHEYKHEITAYDRYILRERLRAVCESDPHAIEGKYFIRSLYIGARFPLEQTVQAHELLDSGNFFGSIVLECNAKQ